MGHELDQNFRLYLPHWVSPINPGSSAKKAASSKGVVTIVVPKKVEAQAKKIVVQAQT